MAAKKLWPVISAVTFFGIGCIIGLVAGIWVARPDSPNLDDPKIWLPIKVYHGALDGKNDQVDAYVSAIFRTSDQTFPSSVFVMQNKIEIKTSNGLFRFFWPDDKTFVAGWCDILDVDGDGIKEFLLYAGTGGLRIVSFTQGAFQFRPRLDELLSFEYDVGPFDLDGDGRVEFVEDATFPSDYGLSTKTIRIPYVKRWSRNSGFIDVSKKYPRYYKEQVVPELKKRLAMEQNPELRQTLSQALEFINREIL